MNTMHLETIENDMESFQELDSDFDGDDQDHDQDVYTDPTKGESSKEPFTRIEESPQEENIPATLPLLSATPVVTEPPSPMMELTHVATPESSGEQISIIRNLFGLAPMEKLSKTVQRTLFTSQQTILAAVESDNELQKEKQENLELKAKLEHLESDWYQRYNDMEEEYKSKIASLQDRLKEQTDMVQTEMREKLLLKRKICKATEIVKASKRKYDEAFNQQMEGMEELYDGIPSSPVVSE